MSVDVLSLRLLPDVTMPTYHQHIAKDHGSVVLLDEGYHQDLEITMVNYQRFEIIKRILLWVNHRQFLF